MRVSSLVVLSVTCIVSSACRNSSGPDTGTKSADAAPAEDAPSSREDAGGEVLSLEFPSEVPPYPGAMTMAPTTRIGREGKPQWSEMFRTNDDPGQVLAFYLQNLHGFRGAGQNRPDGEIRGAWESPKYHVELQAAPLRMAPDAAPFVTSVMVWVDRK